MDSMTVVWATDGSERADGALAIVRDVAQRWPCSRVVAVHIDERITGRGANVSVFADEEDLVDKIRSQIQELESDGFAVEFELRHTHRTNDVSALIASTAEKFDADLIVVATHGHRRLAGALLGSVAQGLLHNAPCPVLVVPPGANRRAEDAALVSTGTT